MAGRGSNSNVSHVTSSWDFVKYPFTPADLESALNKYLGEKRFDELNRQANEKFTAEGDPAGAVKRMALMIGTGGLSEIKNLIGQFVNIVGQVFHKDVEYTDNEYNALRSVGIYFGRRNDNASSLAVRSPQNVLSTRVPSVSAPVVDPMLSGYTETIDISGFETPFVPSPVVVEDHSNIIILIIIGLFLTLI